MRDTKIKLSSLEITWKIAMQKKTFLKQGLQILYINIALS